ncbi:MAG TPA: ATP phosphoribosyltransferase regulatory subunit, partial [Terriglobales bacterium]|nr:ATP phosphoribosyltransferase regulatory subunit [Terriglobales bacterium]
MEQRIFCPQGYRDELYPRSLRRRRMEMRITEYLAGSGYQMVETPEVEYYDLYARYNMPVGQEQMVKFVDGAGRLVVLRPDFTLPAARIMASALSARRTPIKLFYTGRVYRVGGRGGEVASG